MMKYVVLPFIAWFLAGALKFCINTVRFGAKARGLIGYGGFPSTHTTILSAVVWYIGISEGFGTPLFSLGLAALLILIIDAHGLRRKIGEQAKVINRIQSIVVLRERMGHSWLEIGGGLILGLVIALFVSKI